METHFFFFVYLFIYVTCALFNALYLLVGSSATYGWSVDCGAKTTRSSMSCDSIYFKRTFDKFGVATCYEFRKPWVCSLILCFVLSFFLLHNLSRDSSVLLGGIL